MKTLLADIRTRLRAQITYVEDSAIHIVVDENRLPMTTQLPGIGIKDGDESFEYPTARSRNQLVNRLVTIISYVVIPQAGQPELPIMGEGSRKGVLDMTQDIIDALTNWHLSPTFAAYYISRPIGSEASKSGDYGGEDEQGKSPVILWVQRKSIDFEFEWRNYV